MEFLLGLSWERLLTLAVQLGVALGAFLAAAATAWSVTYGAARRITSRWLRSPTQGNTPSIEELAKLISELSAVASALVSVPGAQSSPPSGSSSSSDGAPPTSTSSSPTSSPGTSSQTPGGKSSGAATNDTARPARGSKKSAPDAPGPSATPESTLRSEIRRNCRPCSAIRALVAGGASKVREKYGPAGYR